MDRLKREGNPPVGQLASPVPQYKRPGSTDYDPVEGQHGAPFATLKDASGNIVSPATDAKLEQVKSELEFVKTELATIKSNQLSGDQKVQLSGTIVEIKQSPTNSETIEENAIYSIELDNLLNYSYIRGIFYGLDLSRLTIDKYLIYDKNKAIKGRLEGVDIDGMAKIIKGNRSFYFEFPILGSSCTIDIKNTGTGIVSCRYLITGAKK